MTKKASDLNLGFNNKDYLVKNIFFIKSNINDK